MKNKLLELGFIDNEYLDKYLDLIETNRNNPKIKGKTQGHHIIPKSVFRLYNLEIDNSKENLVNLPFKSHILAHYYLCLCYRDRRLKYKLESAFMYLVRSKYDLGTFNPKTDLDQFEIIYQEYFRTKNERNRGKHRTEEQKKHLSEVHKGKHLNPATEFKKGHPVSLEIREKLRQLNLGQPPSNFVVILQYDLDGNFIKEWESATEPEKVLGIGQPHIIQCCKGKRRLAGGFMWRYKNGTILERIEPVRSTVSTPKKIVLQCDLNGTVLSEYESVAEVCRQTGIDRECIRRCCIGQRKTCKGFIWKFKNK